MAAPPEGSAPPCPLATPANSARGSVLALINSTVGAGVLAFPFAFRQTGWAAGLAGTLLVGVVEACTMFVLARFAEATGSQTYSVLVSVDCGTRCSCRWRSRLARALLRAGRAHAGQGCQPGDVPRPLPLPLWLLRRIPGHHGRQLSAAAAARLWRGVVDVPARRHLRRRLLGHPAPVLS